MEGDDGAIEKELAGAVGDNGWINDCLPGTHVFPRAWRTTPLHPSWNGCSSKSPEKTCETQCEAGNSALGARRRPTADRTIGQGRERRWLAMAWRRAAAG